MEDQYFENEGRMKMIKKFTVIILLLMSYVYVVSSDPDGNLVYKIKRFCNYCYHKYKGMDLEYHVNKWPEKKSSRRRF